MLAGLDLEPLRALLRDDGRGAGAGSVAVAAALRALRLPAKLLPRPEDLATTSVTSTEHGVVLRLEAGELGLRFGAPRFTPAFLVTRVAASADVRDGRALLVATAALGAGSFALAADLPLAEGAPVTSFELTAKDLDPGRLVAFVRAVTGISRLRVEDDGPAPPAGTYTLPRDALFDVVLARAPGAGHATLTATMRTAQTALVLGPVAFPGAGQPVLLAGRLAMDDLLRLNVLPVARPEPVPPGGEAAAGGHALRPLPGAVLAISARLAGLGDGAATAFVTLERIELGVHDRYGRLHPASPVVALEDVSLLLRRDGGTLAWHRFVARLAGGLLTTRGSLRLGAGAATVDAHAALRGVAAADLPIGGGRTLGMLARGSLDIDLRAVRDEAGVETAAGLVRLDDGVFPLLARAEPVLARVGMRPPAETATMPATCVVALSPDGWSFTDVQAAVPGCSVKGRVDVRDGAVDGALVVTLGKELLETSAVTMLPSLLAERITVPVKLAGTVSAPDVQADLGGTLGSLVTNNRVTSLFTRDSKAPPPMPPELAADPFETGDRHDPAAEDARIRRMFEAGESFASIDAALAPVREG
ncbi:MAG: hypothetical protein JWP97_1439 [Labilithrix sp.]|nr:hypothetical protein [Labilithrix sp.]